MLIPLPGFLVGITAVFGLGFFVPILGRRNPVAVAWSIRLALIGSLVSAIIIGSVWPGQADLPEPVVIWRNVWPVAANLQMPPIQWEMRIDRLAAFFGFLVAAFSAIVSIYALEALSAAHYRQQRHRIAAGFNLFVWSTLMVVFANDLFSLIVALEIMTLAFGFLALYKHTLGLDEEEATATAVADYSGPPIGSLDKRKSARLAPQLYLIISHASSGFLLVALLILAVHAQSFSFDAFRTIEAMIPRQTTAVFLLALAGLGIRAGLIPAHFWVSLVHPASPTITHALSLGISIKVALYLMLRFFFQFLPPQAWQGYLLLAVAVFTALANVWYAIASHDLKTALAYHSVENIGIIVAGIAVALIYASQTTDTAQWIAALALTASFYHLLNHAVFKSLLYLATGAIENLTNQTVDFDKLGGLIKLYPATAALFLIGAVSISGFPPFNGFVSEWLTLQALLAAAVHAGPVSGGVVILVSLVVLAAAFALTAVCFYKIAGLTLLGQPRSSARERAQWSKQDAPINMRSMMLLLAGLCLALGLLPGPVVQLLSPLTEPLGIAHEIKMNAPLWTGLTIQPPSAPEYGPVSLPMIGMGALALGLVGVVVLLSYKRKVRRVPSSWQGGAPAPVANSNPTGAVLSHLIRALLDIFPARTAQSPPDYLPTHFHLSRSRAFPQIVVEASHALNNWLIHLFASVSQWAGDRMQNGDIRRYLFYIFVANALVLLFYLLLGGKAS